MAADAWGDAPCVFCEILAGHLPGWVVAESELAVALLDLRHVSPGHTLVLPRRHIQSIYEMDDALASDLMRLTVRVARGVRGAFAPDGLNIWQSTGRTAGQEVPHVHVHVFPRMRGDRLLDIYPGGPPPNLTYEALRPVAERLREALAHED